MAKEFEYTTLANRYTAKFPVLTYVGTQVNFWILANLLLVTILNFFTQMVGRVIMLPISGKFGSMVLIAVVFGVIYGLSLGVANYYLERNLFRKVTLGKVLLFKATGSLLLLIVILVLLRYIFLDPWIAPSLDLPSILLLDESWISLFYLLLIYYFFMTLVISFINQVNKKYGPGVLLPLLLGRYRNPKEEERIFLFMDLKSSTATAEKLGHLQYSSFIRDCFADINELLFLYEAQVYQYVGDEIVVTWTIRDGLRSHFCIRFYFACKRLIQNRADYYLETYGILPEFKAGVHMGKVTAVEIGEIKKDIAYHGDTLNTTSRIQGICNDYGRDLIVSEHVIENIGSHPFMETETLGKILLRGKTEKIGIIGVEWTE